MSHSRRVMYRALKIAAVPLAALACLVCACFDESTYQGGGRRDIGGKLAQVDASTEEELDAEPAPIEDAGQQQPVVDTGAPRDVTGDGG